MKSVLVTWGCAGSCRTLFWGWSCTISFNSFFGNVHPPQTCFYSISWLRSIFPFVSFWMSYSAINCGLLHNLHNTIPQMSRCVVWNPTLLCMTCRYTPDSQCVTQMGKNNLFLPLPLICQADSWQMCRYLSHCWTAATTDRHIFLVAVRGLDNGNSVHTQSQSVNGWTPVGENKLYNNSLTVTAGGCRRQSCK